jgi:hypothetical protein
VAASFLDPSRRAWHARRIDSVLARGAVDSIDMRLCRGLRTGSPRVGRGGGKFCSEGVCSVEPSLSNLVESAVVPCRTLYYVDNSPHETALSPSVRSTTLASRTCGRPSGEQSTMNFAWSLRLARRTVRKAEGILLASLL